MLPELFPSNDNHASQDRQGLLRALREYRDMTGCHLLNADAERHLWNRSPRALMTLRHQAEFEVRLIRWERNNRRASIRKVEP